MKKKYPKGMDELLMVIARVHQLINRTPAYHLAIDVTAKKGLGEWLKEVLNKYGLEP